MLTEILDTNCIVADYNNVAHAEAILEMMDCYAIDPMGGGKPLAVTVRENLVSELAQFPGAVTLLCYEGSQAVGLLTAFPSFSTFRAKPLLNIHDVIVRPAWRGQGIGLKLLEAVEVIARERGCAKLTLEVLQGNRVAQGLYRTFGFSGYELDPATGSALFWEKHL